jgi:cytochrome oxidase Cu insertion factor (SCO1/SenC/PrrC family)
VKRKAFAAMRKVVKQTIIAVLVALSAGSYSLLNGQRSSPVAVGDLAPDFVLTDQNGQKVTLSDSRGKSPVVLLFYRGYW